MDPRSAADAYRTASIENAPPIKIIRLLYEGALRFLDQAASADPRDPRSDFAKRIGNVDDIVVELRLAIDDAYKCALTDDLERLYLYCEDELGRALVERSVEPLPGVRRVLEILLDAWEQVEVETTRAA
jgi:flagellar protein FliS